MNKNLIFILSALGILAGLGSAYYFASERKAQPPVFEPTHSPYPDAIFANGIIEGVQGSGSNINVYAEVAAPVTQVLVHEGQSVKAGDALVQLDDAVEKATVEQLRAQAAAAQSLLDELRAQPRKETLEIARAQVVQAQAALKNAADAYAKRQASYDIDPQSVSKDVLDSAHDAQLQAESALLVAQRQLELTQAGAWTYDIANQQHQVEALTQSYKSAQALLGKYTLRAAVDGTVMAVNAGIGSYTSSQGAYNPYTQGTDPVVVMSRTQDTLQVRCYVDEILVARLDKPENIRAQMSIRGTDRKVDLVFDRIQPLITPKIQLSDQRQEKVDLRVLPVIFHFRKADAGNVYPGQLVDVYIGGGHGSGH